MTEERCWYTLDPAAQPVGPYSIADLTGYASTGLLAEAQVFWKEGKSSWDKLTDVPELEAVLKALREHKAQQPAAGGTTPRDHAHHAHVLTGKPSDPLEAFKHEIAAVEAGAAEDEAADPDAAAAGGDRAATPDELEFEDDDGTMYRWDSKLRKYIPADEAAAAAAAAGAAADGKQQQDYDIEAMTFVAEEEVIPTLAAARAAAEAEEGDAANGAGKKAGDKRNGAGEAAGPGHKGKKQKSDDAADAGADASNKQDGWTKKSNTAVYVTGLPDDTDADEVAGVFAKCGIIKLDEAGQPRVKLYRDKESGMLKGDGLVIYLKEPSVALACQILDGTPLRDSGPAMSVTPATFENKGGQPNDNSKKQQGAGAGGGGGKGGKWGKGGKGGKGKKKPLNQLDILERKLGWGGFDDRLPPEKVTVVLKGMFSPSEADEGGATFASELEADVLAECTKLGAVEKVRVYAAHPAGVVTVRFKQEEPAHACLDLMHGRFFGGNKITAHMWDGITNYHVKVDKHELTAEEEAARLETFARELEEKQHAQEQASAAAPQAAAATAEASSSAAES